MLDRARSTAFYRDVLGLPLTEDGPLAVVFEMAGAQLRLTPVPVPSIATYTALGWRVTNVDTAVDQLAALGVVCERFAGLTQDSRGICQFPSGARVAWFRDPDGHLLSVSS